MKRLKNSINYITVNDAVKCLHGVCVVNGHEYYYKQFKTKKFYDNEMKNINKWYDRLNLAKIAFYSPRDKVIVYTKIDHLDQLTLHNFIYNSDVEISEKLLNELLLNFISVKKMKLEQNCKNNELFQCRLFYLDSLYDDKECQRILQKDFWINGKLVDFNEIFDLIRSKLSSNKKLHAFISNGDPTDKNILINGMIIDAEYVGYNSIVGDLAVLFNCLMINGYYFFIKYAKSSYSNSEWVYEKCKKNIKFAYEETDYKIDVNLKINEPERNIEFLSKFYNKMKQLFSKQVEDEINTYFKWYFLFRLIAPKKISEMELDDKILTMSLIAYYDDEENWPKDVKVFDGSLLHSN